MSEARIRAGPPTGQINAPKLTGPATGQASAREHRTGPPDDHTNAQPTGTGDRAASARMPHRGSDRADQGARMPWGSATGQNLGMTVVRSIALFIAAGLAEISGGYLVWRWLREGAPLIVGVLGGLILVGYGIIPTLQKSADFGRIYAAYGGVFVVASLLWGWGVDGKQPDRFDWTGAAVVLAGVAIIYFAPRR
jgi:small multidrug resistance family-3 protein